MWTINAILAVILVLLVIYLFVSRMKERQVEERLRSKNQRLVNILRPGDVTLWTYDLNRRLFHMYEMDMSYVTETIEDMEARMDKADFKELINCMIRVSQGLSDKEHYLQRVSRRYGNNPSEMIITPMNKQANGQSTMLMAVQHDMTKQVKQRIEDERTMMLYQALFNGSYFDVFIFDSDGYLIDMNEHACMALGVSSPDEMIAKKPNIGDIRVFENFDWRDGEGHAMINRITFEDNGYCSSPLFPKSKGNNVYYESALIPIYDNKGQLAYMCMRGMNITDVVEGFHNIRRDSNRLSEATRKIEKVLNEVDHVLVNTDTQLSVFEPDIRRQTFYRNVGKPNMVLDEIQIFYTIKPESHRVVMDNLLKTQARVNELLTFIMHSEYKNPDGSERWLKMIFHPVLGPDGKVEKYMGAMYNDSHLITTSNRLLEEKQKAEEADSIKGSFLKNMSYEIRTPLNSIFGFSDLLSAPHSKEDEAVFVAEIKRNSEILLKLISDVLLLSRLDADMLEIHPSECDLAAEFSRMCSSIWEKYHHDGVEMVVESPYERLDAVIDTEHLEMILDRIIQNAAQYTDKGTVNCRMEYVGGTMTFTIDDTGRGISKENLSLITDRFTRLSDGNGAGLGLPISKSITELMGGKMGITSKEGEGTTVWVSIPCNVTEMKKKKVVYLDD